MNKLFRKTLVLSALVVAAGSAAAAPTLFDFANLKYSNNTFSGFLPTDGFLCSGGDKCSSQLGNSSSSLSGDLTYSLDGITVHATGKYGNNDFGVKAAVVQDHDNGYDVTKTGKDSNGAGLGVYHKYNDNSDDNITKYETLWMHFDQVINLSSIGLRSEGHNTTGWVNNATFQYSFDNTSWISGVLPKNNGNFALSSTGSDFYFRYGGSVKDQFYLSSMTVSAVTAVPETETYAMMLVGLGLMGAVARRRKAKSA
jgi:hypothetical protein